MITPRFSLDQTETQIILTVHSPYTNVKNTEIHVEGTLVIFNSPPYYLNIELPESVEETDNSSAKYISDESKFVITLDKSVPGLHFKDLDLIATLLQPKARDKVKKRPLIEVLEGDVLPSSAMEEITDDDWHMDQSVQEESIASEAMCSMYGYGFGSNHKGLGSKHEVELGEVSEIQNPDSVCPATRRSEKYQKEQEKFSDDYYLSDLMLENDIPRLIDFKFDIKSLRKLTADNLEQMKNMGNREFLLDKAEQRAMYLGIVDIIFAYCYDWRISEGSHAVESVWNISRISGTLSWFVTFASIPDVIISSLRRSLCYPLHRNWNLSLRVFTDVIEVLKTGPTGILICLLDIRKLFNQRDPYYLMNQLYIDDYCVWIQKMSSETSDSLSSTLEKELQKIGKADIKFDLEELELAAKLVEDEEMDDMLSTDVSNIKI